MSKEIVVPGQRLKVLLICHWFPPSNVIGAVRVGHFAKSLHEAGHDVRVLTAENSGDRSLPMPLPADRVIYIRARRGGELLGSTLRFPRRSGHVAASGTSPQQAAPGSAFPSRQWMVALRRHYYALLHIPDPRAPWMRRVTATGSQLVKHWRPDIILASAPPNSGLIAARRIARVCGAPWIADLRDLWADDPYYTDPRWRLWIDRLVERAILRSAAGLITVSPIWADTLRHKYEQPVACILNGFVSEDFPALPTGPEPDDVVSILYTGNIYAGYRDPTPLFRAIGLLTPAERQHVAVHFYGPSESGAQGVITAAAAAGVADRVFLHDRVSYRKSLSLQQSADVLLLLQWNNVKDAGNIPAKFFEYLGARRPILLLGYEHGNLAQMIRERGAGVVANDPSIIAKQLRHWIGQRSAGIPAVPAVARDGMSRADQYHKLEQFLAQVIR
ncbi:MAG TPA: glycosyltransferase family 4 protein [Stellaceae bacterium]|nr:glycosyltransferase family 4 protein [Stellaceae bacterium]